MLKQTMMSIVLFAGAAAAAPWSVIPAATFPDDLGTEGVLIEALNLGGADGSSVTYGGITYSVDNAFFSEVGGTITPGGYVIGDADADQILGTAIVYATWGVTGTAMATIPLTEGNVYRAQLVIGHPWDWAACNMYTNADFSGDYTYNASQTDNGADISITTYEFTAEVDPSFGVAMGSWSLGVGDGQGAVHLLAYTLHDITDIGGGGCSAADVAEPFDQLDLFDILTYFDLFGAGDLGADISGDGTLDLFDILGFFEIFGAGC